MAEKLSLQQKQQLKSDEIERKTQEFLQGGGSILDVATGQRTGLSQEKNPNRFKITNTHKDQ